jgi:predicted TIM-barrel fold metal-dependent hydrolase
MFDHRWTLESLRPLILETLEAFGTERAMFASNFPVDKLFSDYPMLWRTFAAVCRELQPDELAALLSGNAMRFYRLSEPTRRLA